VQYEGDLDDGQFYAVLKKRVEKYFRENQIDPRASISMYLKTFCILAGLTATFYGALFASWSLLASYTCTILLGVCMAEVGVSIQHDANHGAYSRAGWATQLMGASLDVVGASSFMWRQQHVVGHHAFTNLDEMDPDIRVKDPDVRRVTQHQPWQQYQAYQHIYLGVLYGLLALKSVLVDDFLALSSGSIGSVSISKLTLREQAVFWGGKVLWLLYFIVLPVMKSHHSWSTLLGLWVLSEMVTGWCLALMFQVAHVVPDVEYLQHTNGKVARGWAAAQVATTADFSHGSWFWTHISGGLNYQVVHHLFPGICHTHYPAIAPIVLDTCKEFGVPYKVYPSFWAALHAHFSHLKTMGAAGKSVKPSIPSLASVG
jgi:fatty acid desaturase